MDIHNTQTWHPYRLLPRDHLLVIMFVCTYVYVHTYISMYISVDVHDSHHLCLYQSVNVFTCAYIHTHEHTCTYGIGAGCRCAHISQGPYMYASVYICKCTYCLWTHEHLRTRMFACLQVSKICIHIYTYTCTCSNGPPK